LTENAGSEIQDIKLTDQNAGHENTGQEFARQDKSYENRLIIIVVFCVFVGYSL